MTQMDDLRRGIKYLVSLDPDNAKEKNEVGLSKFDSEDAHNLAKQTEPWNDKQVKIALRICDRHRRQLPSDLREKLDKITSESIRIEAQRIEETKRKALNSVRVMEAEEKIASRTFRTEDGTNVYLENFVKINPAQDFHDGIAYITQSLWYDKPIFDKDGNLLGNVKEQGVVVIMSNKKTLLLSKKRNQYGNLLMDVPDTAPDNRFSIEAIQRFLTEDVDENPWVAFEMAREQYRKYIDFGSIPSAQSVSAIYDYLSYFQQLFETVPYLWYTGDPHAAKTKNSTIHELLGFNALMAVGQTAPNLFRAIKDTRGMQIIDEAEDQGSARNGNDEDKIVRQQIINSGYKKQGKTSRIERGMNGKQTRVIYPTYSTKVIGGINGVSETIRDRSFKILMLRTNNKEIANAVVSDSDPVWQQIRDKFYITMLKHWTEVQDIIKNRRVSNKHTFQGETETDKTEELELIGRDWEKAEPILTIAQWLSGYGNDNGALVEEVWKFLKYQREIEEGASIDTLDATIISKVEEIFTNEHSPTMELKRISNLVAQEEGIDTESNKFNLSRYSRKIRERIEKTGLGKDFRHGSKNVTVFDTSAQLIKETKERYKLDVTIVNNLTNLDNLTNLVNNVNPILDKIFKDNEKLTGGVIEGLSKGVIEKLAVVAEKLSRLALLSTGDRSAAKKTESDSKEVLEAKLKEHMESQGGSVALKDVYDKLKEWTGKDGEAVQQLIEYLKDGKGFNFNYSTQNVSLVRVGGSKT